MFNNTKDAKYYYEEGFKKYLKGSKSVLKYMQKALELAQNDPETSNELFNDIYSVFWVYYDKLSPDYFKALIYLDKVIDTNTDDKEMEKAKEFRAEVKANPDKFDEQTLLKRANQIRIMNEPDSDYVLLYIKYLILFNNPKCDEIFYIVAQKMNSDDAYTIAERNIKQAIAINPNKQEYYDLYSSIINHIVTDEYGEKDFAKTVKKYDKIMKEIIKKSISIKPTAQAYLNYYRYYSFLKDVKSAMKSLDKAITLDPENAFMYEYRAELKSKNGDIDGAIKDYESALAINHFEEVDYVAVANLYYEKFGKEKVYEYFEEKMSQFVSEKDLYLHLLINKVNFEKEYGDYELCLLDFDRVINLPQYTLKEYSIYPIKATCLCQKGDYENALKAIDYAIELYPSYAQNYFDKGDILAQQKKYEEAIDCYKKAEEISLKIDGYIQEFVCFNVGCCYGELEKYIDALKYYNKAIKNGLDSWYPYRNKVGLLIHFGKYKLALKWAEKAEKLFKKELDDGFYGNKGLICFYLKDYKNAVKNFKKYPQWSSGQILTAYIDFLQGNSKIALQKLDKIELTTPAEVDSKYIYITVIYYKNKEYDKALETLTKMKDKNSFYLYRFYHYWKSVIYKELGDSTSAEENLNMAKSTLKENETMENMIRLYEEEYQIKFN